MRPEKLMGMANKVAVFFRSYPDEEAVSGVHRHLVAFWTPTMLTTLRTAMDNGLSNADRLVTLAMHTAPTTESPAEKVLSPADQTGVIASDAG